MITPVRDLPNGELFYSDLGIFPFQAEGCAELYCYTDPGFHDGRIAVWDAGIGKSVLALVMATTLFEEGEIDQVVIVCEKNKVREWVGDVERFTALSVVRYHDPTRHRRLEKAGDPHVLVTVYETGRDELLVRDKVNARGPGRATDGPLFERIGLRSKRIFWVFDEPIKFKNRSSSTYKAYYRTLEQLRRGPHHQRVIGLSMTPMDTDISQAFNIGRMIFPNLMPSVKEFEDRYTNGTDDYGRYRIIHGMKQVFGHFFQQGISRKRKTDPDVIDQFPKLIEESRKVPLDRDQRNLISIIRGIYDPPEDQADLRSDDMIVEHERQIRIAERATAGHPAAHLHLNNQISQQIVQMLGEQGLRSISSAKTKWLIDFLTPLVKGQGAQVVIFDSWTSIITEVAQDLRDAGFTVAEYHGKISDGEKNRNIDEFKRGGVEILFGSDSLARGVNLANAQYVIEYCSASTYSNREQRNNRNNRIDSKLPSTTALTMVAMDTVEEDILAGAIERNRDMNILVGDVEDGTAWISASTRKTMLQAKRRRKRTKEIA